MTMKNFSARIAFAGVALLPLAAFGQSQVFTDSSAFLGVIGDGYYAENFSGIAGTSAPSFDFHDISSTFAYTVNAPTIPTANPPNSDVVGIQDAGSVNTLSTAVDGFALNYTITSGNVRAIGGYFEITDADGKLVPGQIQFDLSDGTSLVADVAAAPTFFGFLKADGDTLSIATAFPIEGADPLYIANTQLFVGVPETSTYAAAGFMGLAVGGLWYRRSRKAA